MQANGMLNDVDLDFVQRQEAQEAQVEAQVKAQEAQVDLTVVETAILEACKDKLRCSKQKYRLTQKGRLWLDRSL